MNGQTFGGITHNNNMGRPHGNNRGRPHKSNRGRPRGSNGGRPRGSNRGRPHGSNRGRNKGNFVSQYELDIQKSPINVHLKLNKQLNNDRLAVDNKIYNDQNTMLMKHAKEEQKRKELARRQNILKRRQLENMEEQKFKEDYIRKNALIRKKQPNNRSLQAASNPDIREILKKISNIQMPGHGCKCGNHANKSKPCPSEHVGLEISYILLDSNIKNQIRSDPSRGIYSWDLNIQGVSSTNIANSGIGIRDKISNIIAVSIDEFCMAGPKSIAYIDNPGPTNINLPILIQNAAPYANSDETVNAKMNKVPFCDLVTIEYSETGRQSFPGPSDTRFQWIMKAEQDVNDEKVMFLNHLNQNKSTYYFTDTIQEMDKVTLKFRGVDKLLCIPDDILYAATISFELFAGPKYYLTFVYPNHGLVVNDRIFINGYNYINPTDATTIAYSKKVIKWINRDEGHLVGANGITDDVFRLNPDIDITSIIQTDGMGNVINLESSVQIDIMVAKRRILIPMKVYSVTQRVTNYNVISNYLG